MKKIIISGIVMAVATLPCLPVKGQGKVVPFKYGNMDHWGSQEYTKKSGIYRRKSENSLCRWT